MPEIGVAVPVLLYSGMPMFGGWAGEPDSLDPGVRTMRVSRVLLLVVLSSLLSGPASHAGDWPQFRGPDRNAISKETGLLRKWPEGGPTVLWRTDVCEGYSSPAIVAGRVYLNDYDREAKAWLVRCLTLDEGKELWRFSEAKRIRPNHGITRTTPAVDGKFVITLDPKCVLHGLDAVTGAEVWSKNLVGEYDATIPAWYVGQSPLLESDRVIVATGGKAVVAAFDKATGAPLWETPNPEGWAMSHASVMPAEIDGVKQYVYCTLAGAVGVDASDGRQLWSFPWKFNVAVPVSPVPISGGRFFLTSCYEAETVMLRVTRDGNDFKAEKVFSLESNEWNSETHTPIYYNEHLFAVGKKRRGLFTCLDLEGKQVWTSDGHASFGLGNYILADGMFFALEGKTGMLRLLDANTTEYKELASAQILSGHDVWAPMALSDGRLVLRDMTTMVCVDVRQVRGGEGGK